MVNVYSDVKKNYKSAELLMLTATKAHSCCAFMQWAGMEEQSDTPVKIIHAARKKEKNFSLT